jgi:hypothetical protein
MEIRDGGGASNGGAGHTRRMTSFNMAEERLLEKEHGDLVTTGPVDLVILFSHQARLRARSAVSDFETGKVGGDNGHTATYTYISTTSQKRHMYKRHNLECSQMQIRRF